MRGVYIFGCLTATLLFPLSVLASPSAICTVTRILVFGSRGADVTTLQLFLADQGSFTANATGYFGPITEVALANFQLQAGIIASIQDGGAYGPRTRAYVKTRFCAAPSTSVAQATAQATHQCPALPAQPTLSCGSHWDKIYDSYKCHVGWTCISAVTTTTTNHPPQINAITGPTTLQLNESDTYTISATDPDHDPLAFSVIWGDEGGNLAQLLNLAGQGSNFSSQTSYTHSYSKSGAYTIIVFARDTQNNDTKATLTVTVKLVPPPATTYSQSTYFSQGSYPSSGPCSYNGATYPEGTQTEGFSPTNLCLPGGICQNRTAYIPTYTCRSGQWVTGAQTTGASCMSYGGMQLEGTIWDGSMILTGQPYYGGAVVVPMWQCKAGVWTCHSWCTPGTTFNYPYGMSPNASCTFQNTPVGSYCGGKCHNLAGVNAHFWGDQCVIAQ